MRGVTANVTRFLPLPSSVLLATGMLPTAIWLLGTVTSSAKVAL